MKTSKAHVSQLLHESALFFLQLDQLLLEKRVFLCQFALILLQSWYFCCQICYGFVCVIKFMHYLHVVSPQPLVLGIFLFIEGVAQKHWILVRAAGLEWISDLHVADIFVFPQNIVLKTLVRVVAGWKTADLFLHSDIAGLEVDNLIIKLTDGMVVLVNLVPHAWVLMFQVSPAIFHLLDAVVQLWILLFHHPVNFNILLEINYLQFFKHLFLLVFIYPYLLLYLALLTLWLSYVLWKLLIGFGCCLEFLL